MARIGSAGARIDRRRARARAAIVAATVVASSAVASAALAAPPHGDGGHTHHIVTGNGDCVDVDAVAFLAEDRGLHRGASASGRDHGPWHGACA